MPLISFTFIMCNATRRGQLWTLTRFSTCNPNSPAPIITVVATNHLRTPRVCPPENIRQKALEASISDQDGTSKTQVNDDNTPPTLCSKEEVGALEGVLHRQHPGEYQHTPVLLLATRNKVSKSEQRCPIRIKTPRQARLLRSHILHRSHPE